MLPGHKEMLWSRQIKSVRFCRRGERRKSSGGRKIDRHQALLGAPNSERRKPLQCTADTRFGLQKVYSTTKHDRNSLSDLESLAVESRMQSSRSLDLPLPSVGGRAIHSQFGVGRGGGGGGGGENSNEVDEEMNEEAPKVARRRASADYHPSKILPKVQQKIC